MPRVYAHPAPANPPAPLRSHPTFGREYQCVPPPGVLIACEDRSAYDGDYRVRDCAAEAQHERQKGEKAQSLVDKATVGPLNISSGRFGSIFYFNGIGSAHLMGLVTPCVQRVGGFQGIKRYGGNCGDNDQHLLNMTLSMWERIGTFMFIS